MHRYVQIGFPISGLLRRYSRADFAGDGMAAVIVTIMLIPQSLAYAMLAGLPPEAGLYASIAPLILYAVFGTSSTLAVGPVAVVSLMTAVAVGDATRQLGTHPLVAAAMLALLSGMMLFALGMFRLGFLASLLSHPVISGFISASAVVIAVGQLKHILGVAIDRGHLPDMIWQLGAQLPMMSMPTLVLGIICLALLFGAKSRLGNLLIAAGLQAKTADMLVKAAPAVVVIGATLAVTVLDLTVARVGAIPQGLPPLSLPVLDWALIDILLVPAFLISLVGFVESVSVGRTLAAKRRESIDANQELLGLGAANMAASLTGGYPVTGGFARSVVNFAAGARTPLAGAMTAILIAVATLVLAPFFADMPQAVLAATIIVAVLGLVDIGMIRRVTRYSKGDGIAMIGAIFVVFLAGVEAGITVGVLASLALHIIRTGRPHMAILGRVPGTEHYRNVARHQVVTSSRVLALRIDESLYFLNSQYLESRLLELVSDNPALTDLVLICSAVNHVDASAVEALEMTADSLKEAGVTLHLGEVKGPVMDRLQRSDLFHHISPRVFLSAQEAFDFLDGEVADGRRPLAVVDGAGI